MRKLLLSLVIASLYGASALAGSHLLINTTDDTVEVKVAVAHIIDRRVTLKPREEKRVDSAGFETKFIEATSKAGQAAGATGKGQVNSHRNTTANIKYNYLNQAAAAPKQVGGVIDKTTLNVQIQ